MALTLLGTGGLMTRVGRFGKVAYDLRTYQGTTLPANVNSLMAQFDTLRFVVDGVPTADKSNRQILSSIMGQISPDAAQAITEMVKADKPSRATSLTTSLTELIAQMRTAVASVKKNTVTATTAAVAANTGDGVTAVSVKRFDGLDNENLFPETAPLDCTSDSQTGGATAGQEGFTYIGQVAQSDVWAENYPIGSGVTTALAAVDPAINASTAGNLLTNSDFESFTSNLPDNWTALVGTAGTDFLKSTAVKYAGNSSLQFAGGTGVLSSLAQTFNLAAGTVAVFLPDTVYAFNYWVKADVVPAAGVLTLDLIDGSNVTINDDQAAANTNAVTLSAITTSFVAKNGFFRTPKSLPATQKFRVRITTAISAGSNVFVDRLSFTPAIKLYAGGPYAAVFSGATKFVLNDSFTLTTTNDFGGATNLGTFQQLFERLFGMRALDMVLPSNAAPTIADTLISV